jgi:hypothetical protein
MFSYGTSATVFNIRILYNYLIIYTEEGLEVLYCFEVQSHSTVLYVCTSYCVKRTERERGEQNSVYSARQRLMLAMHKC